jgi:hypothetical protein
VPKFVVYRLEEIDVDDQKGQRPMVPYRPGHFALEEFQQISMVVNFRESVADGEPVNLFVVLRLHVSAAQKPEDRTAHAQIITVVQPAVGGRLIVDESAVHTLEVFGLETLGAKLDTSVRAGYGMIVQSDVAIIASAYYHGLVAEKKTRAHSGTRRVDLNQTRIAALGYGRPFQTGVSSFGQTVHSRSVGVDSIGGHYLVWNLAQGTDENQLMRTN